VQAIKNLPFIRSEIKLNAIVSKQVDINETIKMEDFLETIKNKTSSYAKVNIDGLYSSIIYENKTDDISEKEFKDRLRNIRK
jgi:hypothetical protein